PLLPLSPLPQPPPPPRFPYTTLFRSTTTTTTSPASTGARLRLLEKDLGQPPPGTQSVLVTVIDPAEPVCPPTCTPPATAPPPSRSEEHTSELQSLRHLVCRLLLEKKN